MSPSRLTPLYSSNRNELSGNQSKSSITSEQGLNIITQELCNKRNIVQKMTTLREQLTAMQPQSGHCRLEVSREDIFEESYQVLMKMRTKDMRKRLMVKFRGEEGLDYGGVAREWLFLLSHEMLNPCYGLFQYTREDIYTLQINPDSSVNPVSVFDLLMSAFSKHYTFRLLAGSLVVLSLRRAGHRFGTFPRTLYRRRIYVAVL